METEPKVLACNFKQQSPLTINGKHLQRKQKCTSICPKYKKQNFIQMILPKKLLFSLEKLPPQYRTGLCTFSPACWIWFFFLLSRRLSVNKFAAIPFNLHDPRIIKNVNFLGTFVIPPRFILLKNNGQVERFYNRSRKKWAAQSSYFYNFYKDFPCIKIKHHKAVVEFVSQDKL